MKTTKSYNPTWDNADTIKKVKALCTHCGKKQTAEEKNYSLNYVKCKFCNKEGELQELFWSSHLNKFVTIPEKERSAK